MSKSQTQASSGGVGFFGLLTLLFIGLKLGNVITWPWLWVLSPVWGIALIVIVVVLICVIGLAVVKALD